MQQAELGFDVVVTNGDLGVVTATHSGLHNSLQLHQQKDSAGDPPILSVCLLTMTFRVSENKVSANANSPSCLIPKPN